MAFVSAVLLGGLSQGGEIAANASDPFHAVADSDATFAIAASHLCPNGPVKMPMSRDCARMISCAGWSGFGILGPIRNVTIADAGEKLYWMSTLLFAGRIVPPELFPPIALI